MQLDDEVRIAAPRDLVREMLLDPEILAKCIPGCEALQQVSDKEYRAKVVLKVGPIKARFAGEVQLETGNDPYEIILTGKGAGGVAGFAKAAATVNLIDEGEETLLRYDVDAEVGGRLAQLGNRLIVSTARKLAGVYFKTFNEEVSRQAASEKSA